MTFEVGDILMLQNIKFEKGINDTRLKGHPVLVIKKGKKYFYFLVISSSEKCQLFYKEYIKIEKTKKNGLYKDNSFVRVSKVYKREIENYIPIGTVDGKTFKSVMKSMQKYIYTHANTQSMKQFVKM